MRISRSLIAAIGIVFGTVLLSACSSRDPVTPGTSAQPVAWPQYGFDSGHSGLNPLETRIGIKNVTKLHVVWSTTESTAWEIVSNGKVLYVDSSGDYGRGQGEIYAVDAASGKSLWSTSLTASLTQDPAVPVVAGNVLVAPCGTQKGIVFRGGTCGLATQNGRILWKKQCVATYYDCTAIAPALYNGLVYYQYFQYQPSAREYGRAIAVDPSTGTTVWDVPTSPPNCPSQGLSGYLPIPASGGRVYVGVACWGGSNNPYQGVCALDAANGKTDWCTDLKNSGIDSLFESHGQVYTAIETRYSKYRDANDLVAMDETNGHVRWRQPLPKPPDDVYATDGTTVFITIGGFVNCGQVYAFSSASGQLVWNTASGCGGSGFSVSNLSLANGLLYAQGHNKAVIAMDPSNGQVVWQSNENNGGAFVTPIIANGMIFAGCKSTICAYAP